MFVVSSLSHPKFACCGIEIYLIVLEWMILFVVGLRQTGPVCWGVEADMQKPPDLILYLRPLWARIRCSCAQPLCCGTSSFPTVT